MTLEELICACRTDRLDDTVETYHWSKAELTRFLNDAQDEACRRARLLTDSSTPEICRIAVIAGTALYTLDPRIIFVRRAKLALRSKPLGFASYLDLDERISRLGSADGHARGGGHGFRERKAAPVSEPHHR